MTALTVRLPDEKHKRLKALAKSRGTPLNRMIDEMTTLMLAEFDAGRVSACGPSAVPAKRSAGWRCWKRLDAERRQDSVALGRRGPPVYLRYEH